jgi:hypothetical protein
MSVKHNRSFATLLSGLAVPIFAVVLSAVAPVQAQTGKGPDLLDKIKGMNEIQAQKMEADVKDALKDAQTLSGSDPAGALDRLQRTLTRLEADRSLTPGRRDLLTRQLRDRIKVAQVEADRAAQRGNAANDKLARTDSKSKDAEARAAENELIVRNLAQITDLQKKGKTREATRQAEDLFRRYPNLAAPQAIGQTTSILDQVAYLNQIKDDRAGRRSSALNSVDRSALAPGSDMEFPKDWATRVAKREPANLPAPTSKEKSILSALDKSISVNFYDAIEELSTTLGQPILLDKAALGDALVTSETQVNFGVKDVKARTVLRKVLADVGLAYIIKDEAIQVVTEKQAKETLVTRSYYLGSLLAGGNFSNAGIRFFPGVTQFEMMQNMLSIVHMIQSSVDPQSWQINGGQGTITFHAPSMTLVIRNTAEVHGMMGGIGR